MCIIAVESHKWIWTGIIAPDTGHMQSRTIIPFVSAARNDSISQESQIPEDLEETR